MGEYVHARVRRHGGGYPRQQGGVQNGLVGRRASSTRGYLTPFAQVGQHGEGGDLRAGTRRGGHRHKAGCPPRSPSFLPNSSMALAQSMGEPPPKATTAWGRNSAQRPGPLGHQLQGRVGHHLVEHLHGAVPQAARTRSSRPDWARKESVITITRRPASPSRAARASDPKKIVGLS